MSAAPPVPPGELTFFEHLNELRSRMMRACLGVLPAIALVWIFKEACLEALVGPLVSAWKAQGLGAPRLHFQTPVEPIVAYLKIAALGGIVLASPWVFWQLWAFVAPGLLPAERRFALPFTVASSLCFIGGVCFAYWVVFPLGFETFLAFSGMLPGGSLTLEPTLMLDAYLTFVLRLLLAFGVVFEVPVVVFFLAVSGMVSPKALLGFSRWWILVATLLAAALTPPDVASQLLMLVPLILLYFASISIAWLVTRKRNKSA